ncbi:MAG TPA: Fur family transcriptional regulator [Candidatus Krumholzibacteriaceae bacterium]
MVSFEETIQKLRSGGFKLTPQRLAVIRYMLGNTEHPSALKIHKELRRRYPTLSFSTVYNTLGMLEKIAEVQSLHIFDDYLNYDPTIAPHIHLYCKGCGNIYDIMFEGRNDVVVPRNEIEGFLIDSIGLVMKGTCKHCR